LQLKGWRVILFSFKFFLYLLKVIPNTLFNDFKNYLLLNCQKQNADDAD